MGRAAPRSSLGGAACYVYIFEMTDRRPTPPAKPTAPPAPPAAKPAPAVQETGGPKGPEPTRYGDWERGGRCIDF